MTAPEIVSVASPAESAVLSLFGIKPLSYATLPRGNGKVALYDAARAHPILKKFTVARDEALSALGLA